MRRLLSLVPLIPCTDTSVLVRLLPANVKETRNGPCKCTISWTHGTIPSKFISCVFEMAALAGDVKIPKVAMSHIITIVFFIRCSCRKSGLRIGMR